MYRPRNVIFIVCLVSLATLWGCRLPRMCLSDQCQVDITKGPVALQSVDLSDLEAPFIGWPLARVCEEATWNPGLIFICDNNSGGIGNIRNYILTCLRYAIEAGATGIVLPQIRTRSDENLSDIMRPHLDFDYFFDELHFRTHLMASCPQMIIYSAAEGIPNVKKPLQTEQISPRQDFGLRGGCDQRDLNRHVDRFGIRFREHLVETEGTWGLRPLSWAAPRVFRLNWGVQWEWPVYRDGAEFVASFGGLLRFRQDILNLGKKTAAAMRRFATSQNGNTASGARYLGIHLRTEHDVLSFWPTFSNQTDAYLKEASKHSTRAAYLATGNSSEARKFQDSAQAKNQLALVTKHQLLEDRAEDLAALRELSWDQQALVDFVVLAESDFFLGVSPSSFSLNVALKRHLQTDGLYTRPWKVGSAGDGRSCLVGFYEKYWDDWLYMYDAIWP